MPLTPDDQYRRGAAFRDLHTGSGTFVIPNPWDAASARLLTRLGFPALATTGAGLAFALGRPDGRPAGAGRLTRSEALANTWPPHQWRDHDGAGAGAVRE